MAGRFLSLFALNVSAALSAVLLPRQGSSAWEDKSLPAGERADNLLPQLSWEEKIAQMGGIRQLLQANASFNRTNWNNLYPLQHGILSESSFLLWPVRLLLTTPRLWFAAQPSARRSAVRQHG